MDLVFGKTIERISLLCIRNIMAFESPMWLLRPGENIYTVFDYNFEEFLITLSYIT